MHVHCESVIVGDLFLIYPFSNLKWSVVILMNEEAFNLPRPHEEL
jgi:hypothetical protein